MCLEESISAMLIGGASRGDSRFRLLSDDLLEYGHASHQIVPTDDEWREKTKGVIAGSEHEKPLIPAALNDFVGRLDDIETPNETGTANRPHFPGAIGHRR